MPKFALAATSRPRNSGAGDFSDIRPGRRPISTPGGVFALLVALLSGVLVTFGPAAPAAAGEPEVIHGLVNEARSANGLAPLTRNPGLDAVAASWAQEMASMGSLEHNPNVGDEIPGGWSRWGENIAQGHPTGAAMHQGWMDSSGHYANIMGEFTDIGVAFIEAGGTTWGVQVFATYAGGSGQAAPAPPAIQPVPDVVPEPESPAEEKAVADEAAAAKAAEEKAAADKAAADEKADEEKAAAEKAAEQKAAKEKAAAKKQAAEKRAAATGSVPTATAVPAPESAEATDVPLSTSVTRAIDPTANPAVLIGMALVLLTALVLLSPTLRRLVLPKRRQPRHR